MSRGVGKGYRNRCNRTHQDGVFTQSAFDIARTLGFGILRSWSIDITLIIPLHPRASVNNDPVPSLPFASLAYRFDLSSTVTTRNQVFFVDEWVGR